MDKELLSNRNRSILRLFRGNFPRVEGPLFDSPARVFFRVWPAESSAGDRPGVEIEFPGSFLAKPGHDFGRCTLEALQRMKRLLNRPKEAFVNGNSIRAFRKRSVRIYDETVRTGPVEVIYTLRPV